MTARQLTEQDGRIALRDHLERKALEARAIHGPVIDRDAIERLLHDESVVRYPVFLRFETGALRPGEFAWPRPRGAHPAEGFDLVVHPCFEDRPDALPFLVAYHLPTINYGDIASHEDAELFGARLLGLEIDAYYDAVCVLADSMPDAPATRPMNPGAACGCSGTPESPGTGCGCSGA